MGQQADAASNLDARGLSIALLVSRYNEAVCEGLLNGALKELQALGQVDVPIWRVPGAFELPLLAQELAKTEKWDAIVCLGAVIRGETDHYDFVCSGVTNGLMEVMLKTGVPVGFGILTTDNDHQALARAAEDEHNKGKEAARTVVEMARYLRKIHGKSA